MNTVKQFIISFCLALSLFTHIAMSQTLNIPVEGGPFIHSLSLPDEFGEVVIQSEGAGVLLCITAQSVKESITLSKQVIIDAGRSLDFVIPKFEGYPEGHLRDWHIRIKVLKILNQTGQLQPEITATSPLFTEVPLEQKDILNCCVCDGKADSALQIEHDKAINLTPVLPGSAFVNAQGISRLLKPSKKAQKFQLLCSELGKCSICLTAISHDKRMIFNQTVTFDESTKIEFTLPRFSSGEKAVNETWSIHAKANLSKDKLGVGAFSTEQLSESRSKPFTTQCDCKPTKIDNATLGQVCCIVKDNIKSRSHLFKPVEQQSPQGKLRGGNDSEGAREQLKKETQENEAKLADKVSSNGRSKSHSKASWRPSGAEPQSSEIDDELFETTPRLAPPEDEFAEEEGFDALDESTEEQTIEASSADDSDDSSLIDSGLSSFRSSASGESQLIIKQDILTETEKKKASKQPIRISLSGATVTEGDTARLTLRLTKDDKPLQSTYTVYLRPIAESADADDYEHMSVKFNFVKGLKDTEFVRDIKLSVKQDDYYEPEESLYMGIYRIDRDGLPLDAAERQAIIWHETDKQLAQKSDLKRSKTTLKHLQVDLQKSQHRLSQRMAMKKTDSVKEQIKILKERIANLSQEDIPSIEQEIKRLNTELQRTIESIDKSATVNSQAFRANKEAMAKMQKALNHKQANRKLIKPLMNQFKQDNERLKQSGAFLKARITILDDDSQWRPSHIIQIDDAKARAGLPAKFAIRVIERATGKVDKYYSNSKAKLHYFTLNGTANHHHYKASKGKLSVGQKQLAIATQPLKKQIQAKRLFFNLTYWTDSAELTTQKQWQAYRLALHAHKKAMEAKNSADKAVFLAATEPSKANNLSAIQAVRYKQKSLALAKKLRLSVKKTRDSAVGSITP